MTTAARPTWHAAVGQKNEGGWSSGGQVSMQFSARDLPAHKKLKTRQIGQGTTDEVEILDLKSELAERERKYEEEKGQEVDTSQQKILRLKENKMLLLKGEEWEDRAKEIQQQYDDADDDHEGQDSNSDDSDSDDDSEDEEEELMRELEKIKREREEERLKKEKAEQEVLESQRKEEILMGNPLTSAQPTGSATIKRKWNDDVVFKNQSRNEPETKKRFINDTIRNDFHRRFLKTYIH